MVGEFRKSRVSLEKCFVWEWYFMDKLVTWSNSQEANEEECSSFMDKAGDWRLLHITGSSAALSPSESMCRCIYYHFPWEVPLLSCIREIPFSRWCSGVTPTMLFITQLPFAPSNSSSLPELPCQSLLSSLAVVFDCLFLSLAQSILPFLKDRKDYVHWMLYHVVDVCHWYNNAWRFW